MASPETSGVASKNGYIYSNVVAHTGMGIFNKLFGKRNNSDSENDKELEEFERYYEAKYAALEKVLGNSTDLVGHAIIPFDIGGNLDVYYYTETIAGTVFASMELIQPNIQEPIPNRLGTYELIMCTKLDFDPGPDQFSPFAKMQQRCNSIMTAIGKYSFEARLEPSETCELPYTDEPNRYLIFDHFDPKGQPFIIDNREHGLLLIIELFESEMRFAMENGSSSLFEKLVAVGAYPYSDLDRDPVV